MLDAVSDNREAPMNPVVRLAGDAAITDTRPMREHYPPVQAAALLLP
jgi:hypothetical protein